MHVKNVITTRGNQQTLKVMLDRSTQLSWLGWHLGTEGSCFIRDGRVGAKYVGGVWWWKGWWVFGGVCGVVGVWWVEGDGGCGISKVGNLWLLWHAETFPVAENICLSNVLLGHTFVSYVYECTLLLILRFPGGLGGWLGVGSWGKNVIFQVTWSSRFKPNVEKCRIFEPKKWKC